ncbi:hypothetical protein BGW36DRAFT_288420 [Talaromyces proteolyticus]|uniref:Zn(2)-C6 fungal-type domain-containing protein n=1 Tax=Talaromyces proteolyticus TaxID=1131652 RepID=A0AAD4Q4R2_9EURO|nr:uncharacterized protein BGW36DRAFT_288420 [Talaromyces proteolyticus]KAH8703536.1 hypothetical protein BGW36DRAFT_288420 [Talaromyces proteolyticus]
MPAEPRLARKERRKYHHKSRNGCAQCKQRHIKCDEAKPRCGNCIQADRICSFLGMMPAVPSPGSQSASTPVSAQISPLPVTPSPTAISDFSKYSQSSEFSLMDLAMLHNFTYQTSRTLSLRPKTQELWATTVVEMAFHHRFLLHGLFAVSALQAAHAGSDNPRQLVDYASEHQTISLRLYQLAIPNADEDQYDAVFALSILIFIYAIAMTGDEYGETGMLDWKWIRLARGIRDVSDGRFEKIKRGPMSLLIFEEDHKRTRASEENIDNPPSNQQLPSSMSHSLPFLGELWQGETPLFDLTETDRKTFDESFSFLRHTYSTTAMQRYKMMTENNALSESEYADAHDLLVAEAFFWVFNVSERYIELLEQHHPIALILFAHYAILFGDICQAWFSERSSQSMVSRIWAVLDKKLRKWIEGPVAALQNRKNSIPYK